MAEANSGRLAVSLPSSISDDVNFRSDRRSTYPDVSGVTLDEPVPPAEYSSKYASRPLPQTPLSASASSSYPYNMSLARALDHDCGRQVDCSSEAVTRVSSCYRDEPPEPELPANVMSGSNARYIS